MYFLLCLLVFIKAETPETSRESETFPALLVKDISKESLRNEILEHVLGIDLYSVAKELRKCELPYPDDDVDTIALRKIESNIKNQKHDKQCQNNELRPSKLTNAMGKQKGYVRKAISDKTIYDILRRKRPVIPPFPYWPLIPELNRKLSSKGATNKELMQLNSLLQATQKFIF